MRSALAISMAVVGLAVTAATLNASSAPGDNLPTSPSKRTSGHPSAHPGAVPHCETARRAVPAYRQETWQWQERFLNGYADRSPLIRGRSCHWVHYAAKEWRARARLSEQHYHGWFTRTYAKWECIHSREGSWTSATGNGYYGGLQMDTSFQAAYGSEYVTRWGHAGNWPVWAQLRAAERAYRSRGFSPWPNTAAACGLL